MKVTKDMTVAELIDIDRGIASILMAKGMHCVGCMAAHGESLEDACAVHGIDADRMLDAINDYLASK